MAKFFVHASLTTYFEMITERSIKLLSSVMLISANRIKVLRLWLTCFEDGLIRIFVDVKNEKNNGLLAGVSLPSFSRAPRVSLAPKTPFPFPFKRLPRRLCLSMSKRVLL